MATVGHTTLGFQPDLFDLGHFHVVWDTVLQAPVQDPAIGGTNVYGSGDAFQDAGGNTYRVSMPDGTVTMLYAASPAPAGATPQPTGNQQPHDPANPPNAGAGSPNNPANPISPNGTRGGPLGTQSTSGPFAITGNLGAWLQQKTRVLGTPIPNMALVLGALGGAYAFSQHKKRH